MAQSLLRQRNRLWRDTVILAIKLFLAGIIGVIIGIIWFIAGLRNDPDGVLSGGLWKGPIAFTVGVVALVLSIREITRENASEPEEFPVNPPAPNPDNKPESN
jgi:hypothetical protein